MKQMPCSVARALESMSIILVAGAIVRGYWQGCLGHGFDLYTMGCRRVWYSHCLCKAFCSKGLCGCSRQCIGCCMTVIYRKKTLLRTGILQDLNVGQHHCQNLLQVGSQGIGQ